MIQTTSSITVLNIAGTCKNFMSIILVFLPVYFFALVFWSP